jgi:hypothetical protein
MTLLDRIDQIKKLWTVMLPNIPAPDPAWLGRWCDEPDQLIEHAVVRASKKFCATKVLDPETVWRYVSGVINNEARAARAISKHLETQV